MPYDSASLPTNELIYNDDGIAPETVLIKTRETSGAPETVDEMRAYDGMGNLVQGKRES